MKSCVQPACEIGGPRADSHFKAKKQYFQDLGVEAIKAFLISGLAGLHSNHYDSGVLHASDSSMHLLPR